MYLTEITKRAEKARIEFILSKVLKISISEKREKKVNDEEEAVKFLSGQMIKEVRRALKEN